MTTPSKPKVYVYERSNGRVYAREFGKPDRKMIGFDTAAFKSLTDRYFNLWNDVLIESEQNVALQNALERAIMIYRLSKDDPK